MLGKFRKKAATAVFATTALLGLSQSALAYQGGGFAPDPAIEREKETKVREQIAEFSPKVRELDQNPGTAMIFTQLEQPVSLNFAAETPLEDVLKYFASATQAKTPEPAEGKPNTGIPIYVDPKGLEEAEVTLSSAVKISLEGVPLRTTLRLALKQLGLAYCVRDGLLFISSPRGVLEELREFECETVPANQRVLSPSIIQLAPPSQGGFQ